MSRKFGHIIFALLLLVASSGFTLYQHYCQGHLVSSSLLNPPPSCCGEDSDCCSDVHVTFQLNEDFVDATFHFNWLDYSFDLPELVVFDQRLTQEVPASAVRPTSPGPPDTPQALALLQVYRL